LIFLHNYFIIYDIKYFFLNKINQTIQGGKKNFQENKLPKVLPKNTVFQNPGGACDAAHLPPLQWIMYCDQNGFWTRYDLGMEVKRGQGVVPPPCHLLFLCRLLLLLDQVALVTPIILRGNLSGFLRDLPLLIP
jgi:hypothetical protein